MVYKIGLASTHGTGKTTLAALVEGELKRRGLIAKYLPEVASQAIERGLPINHETPPQAQYGILHQQAAQELLYEGPRETPPYYQVIITDRTVLDNYCYYAYHFGQDKRTLAVVLDHVKKFPYSQVYVVPRMNHAIQADGLRDVSQEMRVKIDQEIRALLQKQEIPHHILPIPEERDRYRDSWVRLIVNQTLQDLRCPEGDYM